MKEYDMLDFLEDVEKLFQKLNFPLCYMDSFSGYAFTVLNVDKPMNTLRCSVGAGKNEHMVSISLPVLVEMTDPERVNRMERFVDDINDRIEEQAKLTIPGAMVFEKETGEVYCRYSVGWGENGPGRPLLLKSILRPYHLVCDLLDALQKILFTNLPLEEILSEEQAYKKACQSFLS